MISLSSKLKIYRGSWGNDGSQIIVYCFKTYDNFLRINYKKDNVKNKPLNGTWEVYIEEGRGQYCVETAANVDFAYRLGVLALMFFMLGNLARIVLNKSAEYYQ